LYFKKKKLNGYMQETSKKITVPKLRFSEPKHNLPGRKGVATAEDRFTIAFTRAYLKKAAALHHKSTKENFAFAREIPVNGYGIADLHIVAWQDNTNVSFESVNDFIESASPCTRAFECKLENWRKALSQALRYGFFSNQAIVVLPTDTCENALEFLETFKMVGVGLWSFNKETGCIRSYYTPRPSRPISERYYHKAIHLVSKASKKTLPIN